MAFMAPLAIAGLALSAAGTAYNFQEKRKTAKAVERINEEAKEKIARNTAAAEGRWGDALAGVTKEEQERLSAEGAAERYAAFEEDTADVGEKTDVMSATEGAPAIVKSEAAKQLGDQLGKMRGMMQAKSRLGGWDDRGLKTDILLGRTGQDIGRYGSFSAGTAAQAGRNALARSQWSSGIGDILIGAGSLASMGSGAMGAAGAAGGAAAGAGSAAAGGAAAAAPAAGGIGTWLASSPFMNWMTTPLNKPKPMQPNTQVTRY